MSQRSKHSLPVLFDLNKIGNSEIGYITVCESLPVQPEFYAKRAYWTHTVPNETKRGGHAHKHLRQIIIAITGIIQITLDDSTKKYHYKLDKPTQALYVPKGYWRDILFNNDATLLCLASDIYIENDYIRNYADFVKYKHSLLS